MSIEKIQGKIENKLEDVGNKLVIGIIGENPSKTAKSPSIWNPTIKDLGINAVFVPLDVKKENLEGLVDSLREDEQVIGFSVTMPYKIDVINYLDDFDKKALQIGAINTVAKENGELVGYNTDGQGAIDSLTKTQPGRKELFIDGLEGKRVFLIGLGGAGRALAFYFADAVGSSDKGGKLYIYNRTGSKSREICKELKKEYHYPKVSLEDTYTLDTITLRDLDLIVNASLVGQSGIRSDGKNGFICLEPYSSLALANPNPIYRYHSEGESYKKFISVSIGNINENNTASLIRTGQVSSSTKFFDIIHLPVETTMLRQARLTGHETLNGKGMNVCQAADAFYNKVFKEFLESKGMYNEDTYQRILKKMYEVW